MCIFHFIIGHTTIQDTARKYLQQYIQRESSTLHPSSEFTEIHTPERFRDVLWYESAWLIDKDHASTVPAQGEGAIHILSLCMCALT